MKHLFAALAISLGACALRAENAVSEVYVSTRDGAKLYTTVQLPSATGKFPVIVSSSRSTTARSSSPGRVI